MGLFTLVALFVPASILLTIFPIQVSQPFGLLVGLTLALIPSAALILVAVLRYSSFAPFRKWQNTGEHRCAGLVAGAGVALSVLLLAKTLHFLYWLIVWDTTYDPLGNFWLGIPFLAVLTSTVVLVNLLPGRAKAAGAVYALCIPAMMLTVSTRAQSIDFRKLTEARAG